MGSFLKAACKYELATTRTARTQHWMKLDIDILFLDNVIAPPSECEVASFHQPRCLRGTLARILTPDGRTQSSAYAQEMGKLHSPKEMMKDYAGEGNMLQFRIVS